MGYLCPKATLKLKIPGITGEISGKNIQSGFLRPEEVSSLISDFHILKTRKNNNVVYSRLGF